MPPYIIDRVVDNRDGPCGGFPVESHQHSHPMSVQFDTGEYINVELGKFLIFKIVLIYQFVVLM